MQYLEISLPSPEENLALDEALLDRAEQSSIPSEFLRLWEMPRPAVVLGRSSKLAEEADRTACAALRIAILRRTSGGAAVVVGPGCLMYSIVLSYALRPALRAVDAAHRFVLHRIATALAPHLPAACRGISDLAIGDRKFSGNSIRCRRTHLLYHGTLLYDFPLALIQRVLRTPPRQPEYRAGRAHQTFLANVPLAPAVLRAAIRDAWGPVEPGDDWPRLRVAQLVSERYGNPDWNDSP